MLLPLKSTLFHSYLSSSLCRTPAHPSKPNSNVHTRVKTCLTSPMSKLIHSFIYHSAGLWTHHYWGIPQITLSFPQFMSEYPTKHWAVWGRETMLVHLCILSSRHRAFNKCLLKERTIRGWERKEQKERESKDGIKRREEMIETIKEDIHKANNWSWQGRTTQLDFQATTQGQIRCLVILNQVFV